MVKNNDLLVSIAARLRSGKIGKLAAAQMIEASVAEPDKLPVTNGIRMYFHCAKCLKERPEDISPADHARLSVGFTKEGLQVWCWRHGLNVAHIHFQNFQHPANTGACEPDAENRSERREF